MKFPKFSLNSRRPGNEQPKEKKPSVVTALAKNMWHSIDASVREAFYGDGYIPKVQLQKVPALVHKSPSKQQTGTPQEDPRVSAEEMQRAAILEQSNQDKLEILAAIPVVKARYVGNNTDELEQMLLDIDAQKTKLQADFSARKDSTPDEIRELNKQFLTLERDGKIIQEILTERSERKKLEAEMEAFQVDLEGQTLKSLSLLIKNYERIEKMLLDAKVPLTKVFLEQKGLLAAKLHELEATPPAPLPLPPLPKPETEPTPEPEKTAERFLDLKTTFEILRSDVSDSAKQQIFLELLESQKRNPLTADISETDEQILKQVDDFLLLKDIYVLGKSFHEVGDLSPFHLQLKDELKKLFIEAMKRGISLPTDMQRQPENAHKNMKKKPMTVKPAPYAMQDADYDLVLDMHAEQAEDNTVFDNMYTLNLETEDVETPPAQIPSVEEFLANLENVTATQATKEELQQKIDAILAGTVDGAEMMRISEYETELAKRLEEEKRAEEEATQLEADQRLTAQIEQAAQEAKVRRSLQKRDDGWKNW